MIEVSTEFDEINNPVNRTYVGELVQQVLWNRNISVGAVTVIFTNADHLKNLKKQFFNEDVYTDVIAFRLDNQNNEPFEGEIYISLEMAEENSQEFNTSFHNELSRLIIHGCLHLLGYEDSTEKSKAEMTNLENSYLKNSDTSHLLKI